MPRSKLDLFAQLLESSRNGTTRTQIVSQADGHQEVVDNALCLLADLDLLMKAHDSPVSLVTTQKGLQFLHDYQNLKKELSSEGNAVRKL